ncbi:MAG: hypothetical protein AAFU53_04075, partial [Cyanobacteria bacterium J06632_3]
AESDQPQVEIITPKADQILNETQTDIQLKVRDFSIYKDAALGLGPHLQIVLDNQPARSVYDLAAPIKFDNLTPGSHTLRAFAVSAWGESFKNEAAYAQTTFHVFAKTNENTPDPDQPVLTYNSPQGSYGAEPVLLDFYLINAPLHQIAQEDSKDDIVDWRIRCTINGQSFVFDEWQPRYIKGLVPGQNWVQLTLIDEKGNPIDNNIFNNTIHTLTYDPERRSTLDKIVRGELPLEKVGRISDPNYAPPEPPPTPSVESPSEFTDEVTDEVDKVVVPPEEEKSSTESPSVTESNLETAEPESATDDQPTDEPVSDIEPTAEAIESIDTAAPVKTAAPVETESADAPIDEGNDSDETRDTLNDTLLAPETEENISPTADQSNGDQASEQSSESISSQEAEQAIEGSQSGLRERVNNYWKKLTGQSQDERLNDDNAIAPRSIPLEELPIILEDEPAVTRPTPGVTPPSELTDTEESSSDNPPDSSIMEDSDDEASASEILDSEILGSEDSDTKNSDAEDPNSEFSDADIETPESVDIPDTLTAPALPSDTVIKPVSTANEKLTDNELVDDESDELVDNESINDESINDELIDEK